MLSVKLLGALEIVLDGKPVVLSRRHARLLTYLLLNPIRHARVQVADVFWPDDGEQRLSNLRHNIYVLRQALGESDKQQQRVLGNDDIRFQLLPGDWVDVLLFDQVDPLTANLQTLIDLANSYADPAHEVADLFSVRRLEHVYKQQSRILARIVDLFAKENDIQNALIWAERGIEHEIESEDAYIMKMAILAEAGSEAGIADVLDQYERNNEVRVSTHLRHEYNRLSEQARKMADQGSLPKHNLPHFDTQLIGRQDEIRQVMDKLRDNYGRMVTLVGMGGMGKTRLAAESARPLLREFPDGIFFVSMAQVDSVADIVTRIAHVLGFRFLSGSPPDHQLIDRLFNKNMLLVLDAFEHALMRDEDRPVITWLDQLLDAAEQVKLMVTSRERLLSPHESVIDVLGLPVPTDLDDPKLMRCESVTMFQQLARRRYSGDMPVRDMARICKLVQGMPLAIELAASWVRVRSCAEIADGIAQGLDLMAQSDGAGPVPTEYEQQHVSLRASFEYSWQQLDRDEQLRFMRLSAFASSCSSEAAKSVADASGGSLMALADKSFIYRESNGYFAMHDLLRQFGREKFTDPQHAQDYEFIQQRMIGYFVEFAQLQSATQLTGHDRLELEWVNLLAVLVLAHRRNAWDAVLQIVTALTDPWDGRARYADALKGHALAVDAAVALNQRPMLLRSLRWQGRMLLEQGLYEPADQLYRQALSMAYDEEDEREIAVIKYDQAWSRLEQNDFEHSEALIAESIALLEEYDHIPELPAMLNIQARLFLQKGDLKQAKQSAERARLIEEPRGPSSYLAHSYKWLSEVAQDEGNWDKAREYGERALSISQSVKDKFAIASAQYALARIHVRTGYKPNVGMALAENAFRTFHDLGVKKSAVYAKGIMGQLQRRLNNPILAREILMQCLGELTKMKDAYACVNYGMHLGDVFKDLGEHDAACTYWREAFISAARQHHPFEEKLRERLHGCA